MKGTLMLCPMRLLYVRHCFLSFPACTTKRVCCGYWHMRIRWVIGWTDQLTSSSAEWAHHSTHLLQYTHINKACDTYNEVLSDQTHIGPPWVLMSTPSWQKQSVLWRKKKQLCSVWSLMSTSTNHSIKLKILKRFPWVFSFNCMGVFLHVDMRGTASISTLGHAIYDFNQSQPVGLVFHSHLVPLWPLSSSCPLERDTYSNGLITRGVHFEEEHRDEMKG